MVASVIKFVMVGCLVWSHIGCVIRDMSIRTLVMPHSTRDVGFLGPALDPNKNIKGYCTFSL